MFEFFSKITQTNGAGADPTTMRTMVNNYKLETFFSFMFINIVIFSILSIYLDQVFPNEFGQKKHPLFFIRWMWMKKSKPVDDSAKNDVEVIYF